MAHILYISWYQIYIENQPFDIQIIKLQMQEQQVEHAIKLIGVDPDGSKIFIYFRIHTQS